MSRIHLLQPVSSLIRRDAFASTRRLFHSSPATWKVHHIKTADEFRVAVKENDKVILDCFATWCGPCKAIAPLLERLSDEAEFKDKVRFIKFDVDEVPALSQELGIRAMPTFLFFKDGAKVHEMVGASPQMLLQALRQYHG